MRYRLELIGCGTVEQSSIVGILIPKRLVETFFECQYIQLDEFGIKTARFKLREKKPMSQRLTHYI